MKRHDGSTEFHAHEREVHVRAYRMWCRDGAPDGRDSEYVTRARALLAAEEDQGMDGRFEQEPAIGLTQR